MSEETTVVDPQSTDIESVDSFLREVNKRAAEVKGSGKLMSALFHVEGGQVHMRLVTFQFPTGDFANAQRLLTNELRKRQQELNQGLEFADELPVADLPEPIVSAARAIDPDDFEDDDEDDVIDLEDDD